MSTRRNQPTPSRDARDGASTREACESMVDKASALRIMLLTIGIQLLFRAMMLLRRWNY
jgi:hypothetical protein